MITLINADSLHIPLADKSVHCVVTSPPYYGLRDYGTAKWEGGDPDCDHQINHATLGGGTNKGHNGSFTANYASTCGKCGATRIDNQIGLEDTPEQYIAKMVEVFREVKRVLRDDGTCWINIGDSYMSQPSWGRGDQSSTLDGRKHSEVPHALKDQLGRHERGRQPGIKPKDLIGIPWMLAFALRADGWYLRSDIIWAKPNPMPESVTDRPTKAHEYVFLLSKSQRYYYDNEAVREGVSENTHSKGPAYHEMNKTAAAGSGIKQNSSFEAAIWGRVSERNRRTVWTIATQPTSEAHFATYPQKLVEPCIKAGCPVGGIVLDPFAGSGTTGIVARQLGRNFIGLDLSFVYLSTIARKRLDLIALDAWTEGIQAGPDGFHDLPLFGG